MRTARVLVVAAVALFAATAVVAGPASAASKADRGIARIATPGDGGLVTATRMRVVVRTSRPLAAFRVWLGLREITGSFRPGAGGRVATIPRGALLRPGVNMLFVRTRDRSGRTDFDAARFVVGVRAPALLSASGRSSITGAAPVSVKAVAGSGLTFRAHLNGRRVDGAFGLSRGLRTAQLAAGDGLRFGRNRLSLVAFDERSGRYDTETRTVLVPRTRPLVGAGPDRLVWASTGTQLDGRASKAFRPRDRLGFAWGILRAPRGSHATLVNPSSARPTLRSDLRGDYVLQLTASEPCRAGTCRSRDTVTVGARTGTPIGSPLETIADHVATIKLDGAPIPGTGVGSGTLSFAVLDPNTLQRRGAFSYTLSVSTIGQFETDFNRMVSTYPKALVIVSSINGPNSTYAARVAALLAKIGAQPFDQGRWVNSDGWSVVGAAGAPAGSALQNVGKASDPGHNTPGDMLGYLQLNPGNLVYSFVFADSVPFDTLPPGQPAGGSTIKVAGKEYTRKLPAGIQAGFHALAFDARSLEVIDENVFTMPGGESNLLGWLTDRINDPRHPLVFLQSVGAPHPATDSRWGDIANRIEQLGGTAAVFNALDGKGDYSLIGRVGKKQIVEESTPLTGRPARIVGNLGRTADYGYEPQLFADKPAAGQELIAIADQPAQQWTPINTDLNKYIAEKLKLADPDVRRDYFINYSANWSNKRADLKDPNVVPYPGDGHGFTRTEFDDAIRMLDVEFSAIADVQTYIGHLRAPFDDTSKGYVDLQDISQKIQTAVAPRDGTPSGAPFELMSKLASVASEQFEVPELAFLSMAAGAVAKLAFLGRSDGSKILAPIKAKTAELGRALQDRYRDANVAITQIGLLLVSDPGKLSAAAAKVNREPWVWPATDVPVQTALNKAAKQWFFTALMPLAWDTWELRGVGNARSWYCTRYIPFAKVTRKEFMYSGEPDAGQYPVVTGFTAAGAPQTLVRALGVPRMFPALGAKPPPDSLVGPLFHKVDLDPNTNNLGLYRPWFYRDFPRSTPPVAHGAKCA